MIYTVKIEKTLTAYPRIRANSGKDAIEMARDIYYNDQIILNDNEHLEAVEFYITKKETENEEE